MQRLLGKLTWRNPANGALYSEDINDATPSKLLSANGRAATSLGVAVGTLELKDRSGSFGGNRDGCRLRS